MKKTDSVKRTVLADGLRACWLSTLFYTLYRLLSSLLTVYTAGVLGSFANAVFSLDLQAGLSSFWILLLCLLLNAVVLPSIDMGGELTLFANSLTHDRMVMGRFLDKTYQNAMRFDAGEAQARLEQDPIDFRCDLNWLLMWAVPIPFVLAYLLCSTLPISPFFTAAVFAVSLLKFAVPLGVKKIQARYDRQNREYQTTRRAWETQCTVQPHMVKMLGLKEAMVGKLDRLFRDHYRRTIKGSARCTVFADNALAFLNVFCLTAILFIGAVLVSQGRVTPGAVAAMMGYFAVFNSLIGDVDQIIRRLPILSTETERVGVLYTGREEQTGETAPAPVLLQAKGVSFSYGEKQVLAPVSFTVKEGEKVALAGPNGSGKSTLSLLLSGLLQGYEGSLSVDGRELRQISPESWRRQLAFVTQDPYLFSGTVQENVRLGNPEAGDAQVLAVMEEMGIAHLARREVTAGGGELSGGERQRVSLARGILKETKLLLFDEPSNNLDAATVDLIGEYIRRCNKTVLFVSHDPQLNQAADQVVQISPVPVR